MHKNHWMVLPLAAIISTSVFAFGTSRSNQVAPNRGLPPYQQPNNPGYPQLAYPAAPSSTQQHPAAPSSTQQQIVAYPIGNQSQQVEREPPTQLFCSSSCRRRPHRLPPLPAHRAPNLVPIPVNNCPAQPLNPAVLQAAIDVADSAVARTISVGGTLVNGAINAGGALLNAAAVTPTNNDVVDIDCGGCLDLLGGCIGLLASCFGS